MHSGQNVAGGTPERGGWVRWALLVVGVAFLLPAPFNLAKGDFGNVVVGLVLATAGLGGFAFMTHSRRQRASFRDWLQEHAQEIASGSAVYDGYPVTLNTTLRTFDVSVSMLLVSSKFSSQYVIDGHPSTSRLKTASTCASLLLGWWGIPFGPVYTVMAVYRNLSGGHETTVRQVLGFADA